jgi:hypothetical protein
VDRRRGSLPFSIRIFPICGHHGRSPVSLRFRPERRLTENGEKWLLTEISRSISPPCRPGHLLRLNPRARRSPAFCFVGSSSRFLTDPET